MPKTIQCGFDESFNHNPEERIRGKPFIVVGVFSEIESDSEEVRLRLKSRGRLGVEALLSVFSNEGRSFLYARGHKTDIEKDVLLRFTPGLIRDYIKLQQFGGDLLDINVYLDGGAPPESIANMKEGIGRISWVNLLDLKFFKKGKTPSYHNQIKPAREGSFFFCPKVIQYADSLAYHLLRNNEFRNSPFAARREVTLNSV